MIVAMYQHTRPSQASLGRRCAIDPSDMVALMATLGGADLVERAPDPADRRRNLVSITPAGRKRLAELGAAVAQAQDTLLAPLSPAERDRLTALLTRIVAHHPPDR